MALSPLYELSNPFFAIDVWGWGTCVYFRLIEFMPRLHTEYNQFINGLEIAPSQLFADNVFGFRGDVDIRCELPASFERNGNSLFCHQLQRRWLNNLTPFARAGQYSICSGDGKSRNEVAAG